MRLPAPGFASRMVTTMSKLNKEKVRRVRSILNEWGPLEVDIGYGGGDVYMLARQIAELPDIRLRRLFDIMEKVMKDPLTL